MSIFTNAPATQADTISDLRSELRRTQARLVEAERQRSQYRAEVATLKRQLRAVSAREVPTGDMRRGYRCPECMTGIDYPEEQNFCPHCGCGFDWRTYAPADDSAYDLAGDR